MKTVAFVGNPNSGKSTLFNALTGAKQFVGNWPGVTVEKKEGKATLDGAEVSMMDTPGIYSLSPYSNEEIITRDYLLQERPDAIVNIVDATNLERNLYLTTQLLELGIPVIVALNMIDVLQSKDEIVSAETLSQKLHCPVCEISAVNNKGIEALQKTIVETLNKKHQTNYPFIFTAGLKKALIEMCDLMEQEGFTFQNATPTFYALKALCRDEGIVAEAKLSPKLHERIDYLNDALENEYDDDVESIIAEQRYAWIKTFINKVILKRRKQVLTTSDKIDRILTHKLLALPLFFAIIYTIYWICLNPSGIGKKLVGITFGWVINVMIWSATTLTEMGCAPWLVSLVSEGVVFGVGIVVAFIPYLMMLFICLAILEECGYMARVTFIMDRVFRRFNLSGKSFIPMLLGTGCTVQAVASVRTLETETDRKMTIFLTPFMPCATKMPVILLVVSILAGESAYIAPLAYLLAIFFIILGGIFLKHTLFKGEPAPFVMELPEYKMPRLKNIFHFVWDRSISFFRKITSIIFLSTVVIWFLKYFSFSLTPAGSIDQSILADIGRALVPIFAPLGFGTWELIAAMITGYVAKDNVLATLGIIYGADAVNGALAASLPPAAAVPFLIFFILSSPCFASMGAIYKELASAKLTWLAVLFQCGSAYIVSLLAYQILCRIM